MLPYCNSGDAGQIKSHINLTWTLLEIQKLAYFLQESGQKLRLQCVKHVYGPYAHNLNNVLEILEGHFIRGYGDNQQPDVEVKLLAGAIEKANSFLNNYSNELYRLNKVSDLVDGFETPYGLELLSSVHWIAAHDKTASNVNEAIHQIHKWSERKRNLFRKDHIKIAWQRLESEEWIKKQ